MNSFQETSLWVLNDVGELPKPTGRVCERRQVYLAMVYAVITGPFTCILSVVKNRQTHTHTYINST